MFKINKPAVVGAKTARAEELMHVWFKLPITMFFPIAIELLCVEGTVI
jgi:hypothetical protein